MTETETDAAFKPYMGIGADSTDLRSLSIRKGGAGWREEISDTDREWAATREPIAHRHTFTVANDIFDNWFKILNVDGEDDGTDAAAQKTLTQLNVKRVFTEAVAYERIFGMCLIVGAFTDAATQQDLIKPKKPNAELRMAEVYPKKAVSTIILDSDESSERYGLPEYYAINRGYQQQNRSVAALNSGGVLQMKVHYSRVIHVATRTDERSVLDVMWDDMTIAKNLRWSMGQTLYTRGPGFPVFTFKGTDRALLAKAKADIMANWTAWTGFVKNEDMDVEFKGAAGAALNPTPYYEPIFDNLSVATETPSAILRGTNAGALTGSETNAQDYFKMISSNQALLEPYVRQFLDWLFASGQLGRKAPLMLEGVGDKLRRFLHLTLDAETEAAGYRLEWNPGFEESAQSKATTDLLREQANQIRLTYMYVDEVRELNNKKPLPNGEGKTVKGLNQTSPFEASPFMSPQQTEQTDQADHPAEQHPSLPALLKGFAKSVVDGDLDGEQAFTQGVTVIQRYSELEQQRAEAWVRAKTGGRVSVLSPEMKEDLDRQTKQYLKDWRGMIDLAKKLYTNKVQ